MANPFTSTDVAQLYSKFRTTYPPTIYDKVFQFLDEESGEKLRQVAVDVGCGSGQNTKALASSFSKVLGVDGSEAQVQEARSACSGLSNITLTVGSAEDLDGFADEGSVDLVTVATALHYFEVKPFFEACHRVLRKGGVLAAYSYESLTLDNPEADEVAKEFHKETLRDYFDPRVMQHVLLDRYQDFFSTLATIFPRTERWSLTGPERKQSLRELSGFIRSMTAYQNYRKQHPNLEDPLDGLADKLKSIYGVKSEDEKLIGVSMDYFAILGKKV